MNYYSPAAQERAKDAAYVGGFRWHILNDVPVFDDFAIFHTEVVGERTAGVVRIAGLKVEVGMGGNDVALGNNAFDLAAPPLRRPAGRTEYLQKRRACCGMGA